MNDPLQSLLQFLSKEVDDACRDDVDVRILGALNWEPVDRPPLVVTYPFPEDAPFRPYPHREILDTCPELKRAIRIVLPDLQGPFDNLELIRGSEALNDVETIYAKAAANRIALIRVAVSEEELVSGRAREQFPTGAVLIHRAESFESARRVARSYRESRQ